MTARAAGWGAWICCGVSVGLQLTGLVFSSLAQDIAPLGEAAAGVALVITLVVGALIASRYPGNAVGWLFCGAGFLLALTAAAYGYADFALTGARERPGGVAAAWLSSWIFLPAVLGTPPLLFLLFPDGRPVGRRWRLAVLVTVVALVCQALGAALRPGELVESPAPGLTNPVGVDARGAGLVAVLEQAGWVLGLVSVVAAATSLVLRYRRSSGHQRLQLRWLASSGVLFLASSLVSAVLYQTPWSNVGDLLLIAAFCAIPVAAGAAMLRHRLYDIDVVINRALVYGGLTATLLAVYLGSVLVLQQVLSPMTDASDLAVAASTLGAAAVFRPARARIQAGVDRRFYRSRYDAARTQQAFGSRLQHELDLEAVGADLRTVVRDTVQPAHVALWLRSPAAEPVVTVPGRVTPRKVPS